MADGSLSYDPNGGFEDLAAGVTRDDSFSYTIDDGQGGSDSATVTVTVTGENDPPFDIQLSNDTVPDSLAVGATVGVLSASDPDTGDGASFTIQNDPDGKFQITGDLLQLADSLDVDLSSSHSVTVRVTDDGGLFFDESFTITVTDGNVDPEITTNQVLVLDEGAASAITMFDLAASDVDNTADQLTFTLTSVPINGSLLLSANPLALGASFTQADINAGLLSYQHDGGETTSDGFDFTLSDGAGGSAPPDSFVISVTPVNDNPFVAINLGLTIDSGTAAPITMTELLIGDPDNTADQLTFTMTGAPVNGSLQFNGTPLSLGANFTQADINAGVLSYQHAGITLDPDSFSFTVIDTSGGFLNVNSFIITVVDTNQDPVAVDDAFGVLENGILAGNVLADNGGGPDTDPNGDPLVVSEVNGSAASVGAQIQLASGALVTLQSDGSLSYDPNGGFEDLAVEATRDDVFSYTIDDGQGGSDSATVTVTVAGENDPPFVAVEIPDQFATVGQGFNFMVPPGSFDDVDVGDVLSLTATQSDGSDLPSWLGFTPATQSFAGTPGPNDAGELSIRVTATDPFSANTFDDFLLTVSVAPQPGVIDATWLGGAGNFNEPSQWSFVPAPLSAQFPNNDADNFFNVFIDGGLTGTASNVALNTSVAIDSLTIDSGDSLQIIDDQTLTIVEDPNRAASGQVVNGGTIDMVQSGAPQTLAVSGNVTLSGDGNVILRNAGSDRILGDSSDQIPDQLTNALGHTIEGAGMLGLNSLSVINQGLIDANLVEFSLTVDPIGAKDEVAGLDNDNILQASNGGFLALSDAHVDNVGGFIQALDGSFVGLLNSRISAAFSTQAQPARFRSSRPGARRCLTASACQILARSRLWAARPCPSSVTSSTSAPSILLPMRRYRRFR